METIYTLSKRLNEYHKENSCVVGQISQDKLELFYDFIIKGQQVLSKTKQPDIYTLTAYIEGETRETEEEFTNRFYCGPYTFIRFSENQFTINRTMAVTKKENCNYLGGLFRIEVTSKSNEALLIYISLITAAANVHIVIPRDKNPDENGIYIYRKDLKLIAKGELTYNIDNL